MELVILGSGSAFPGKERPVRQPAGYALRLSASRTVFMDLGFGNLRQAWRAGIDPATVTDVFCSHVHPDHVGDVAALLFLFRYDLKPKNGKIRLWGPPGFKRFMKNLLRAYAPWVLPRGYRLSV